MCCVSVWSPRATTPKSVCSTSPYWITTGSPRRGAPPARWTLTDGWNQTVIPNSWTFPRIHQTTSAVVVTPGVVIVLGTWGAVTYLEVLRNRR